VTVGKKVMFVVGSPNRHGNTRTVVDWAAAGAREAGADVEIVDAARLKYKVYGCQACMACRGAKEFRCAVDDEAADVIARMPEQDAVVLATPIYFWGLSAQLKHVIDRMFCLVKYDEKGYRLAPGLETARLAFIATAGGGEEWGLRLAEETVKAIAGFVGAGAPAFRSLLVPNAHSEDGVRDSNTALRERAREFGRELAR
jgi:multimeric flavodoxin WrbA